MTSYPLAVPISMLSMENSLEIKLLAKLVFIHLYYFPFCEAIFRLNSNVTTYPLAVLISMLIMENPLEM